MKSVISTEQVPIKLWVDDLEESALIQAKNLANLPFAFKHIAIMPDAHTGYGMPIGGVMATRGVIIPNAVGVDIGCGVSVVRTSLTALDQTTLKIILGGVAKHKGGIRSLIPVGRNHHSEEQSVLWLPNTECSEFLSPLCKKSLKQIGTLGGGNHFIEIQKGSDGFIWVMIHSGSRNVGYQVAKHYDGIAKELNERWHTQVPKDLAFLPLETTEGQNYLKDMRYCVDFARANRDLMMCRVENSLMSVCDVKFDSFIDIAHNYAELEHHYGTNVMIHRKGATKACAGMPGVVPGSQGTSSYVVEGLGNPESFMSCSHGAGRKMSRTKAQKELNLETEKKQLDDLGVVHGLRNRIDLHEAPGAYKDIKVVMENQEDLVKIKVELKPLAVIKS